jgi:hypothetical protein
MTDYNTACVQHDIAYHTYQKAIDDFRAFRISYEDFKAAKKIYDEATAEFDKAFAEAQNG